MSRLGPLLGLLIMAGAIWYLWSEASENRAEIMREREKPIEVVR